MKTELIAAGIAAALLTVGATVIHEIAWSRATRAANAQAQARTESLNREHAELLERANQRERDIEDAARTDLAAQAAQHRKALDHEKQKRQRFAADVHSGAVRLSIASTGAAHCAAQAGADCAAGAGHSDGARAELAPEAGLALAAIADDGDDATRQLNACIAAYETVRARYNGASRSCSNPLTCARR